MEQASDRARSRVAVVTPYHTEPLEILAHCHVSVRRQTLAADHFLIADGHARNEIDGWAVQHVKLPRAHGDCGCTPRGLGALLAASEGYEFVAFLDADNWYHDDHLRSLVAVWEQRGGQVCASFRTFHDLEGQLLPVEEADENALRHIDTSCFLIHRSGFACLTDWLAMPKALAPLCDRIFFAGLLHRRFAVSSSGARTVAFRSQYREHYEVAKRPVPSNAKDGTTLQPALDFLVSEEGDRLCLDALGYAPVGYQAG